MTMPAGKYYIGDLCYVMSKDWGKVCDIIIPDNDLRGGEFTLEDGRGFASYATKHGDGAYKPNVGGFCPVDAGLIGCILINDIAKDEMEGIEDGIIVDMPRPFDTGSQGGVIFFGNVVIDTN